MDDFFGEGLETNEQKRKRKLEEVFDQSFESERRDFNQSLEQEVTVALIGDVNAGKSSTLNAILGREVATVGAKTGGRRHGSIKSGNIRKIRSSSSIRRD